MPLIESERSDWYCFLFLQQLDKLEFGNQLKLAADLMEAAGICNA